MIKFWSKFHFQILWHSFTRDNRFPLTPSLIFPRKILPPASLDTSTTALVCIFSSILNSVMEGWKYRSRELLKAIFCHQKNPKKTIIRKQTFSWNLHEIFFRHLHEMSQPSAQNQQNGKRIYCRLSSLSHFYGLLKGLCSLQNISWVFVKPVCCTMVAEKFHIHGVKIIKNLS